MVLSKVRNRVLPSDDDDDDEVVCSETAVAVEVDDEQFRTDENKDKDELFFAR